MAGAGVDGDMGGMCAVAISAFGVGESAFGRHRAGGGRELSEVQ